MDPPLTPLPALVLCGGRGTRLETETEKPLVPVCGEPMIDRVVRALRRSGVSTVHAVPSPHTPRTRTRIETLGVDVVDTPGDGYVADLQHALDVVAPPVVTVVSDLPHLAHSHVDRALSAAVVDGAVVGRADGTDGAGGADGAETDAPDVDDVTSLTVCVPVSVKESLGVSVDTAFEHEGRQIAPTGLNVVAGETESVSIVDDERLAVNVNRPADLAIAESLCG